MSSSGKRQLCCNPATSSWNNLPPDLLITIVDCVDVTSSVRLSTVCTSWASTIHHHLPTFPPFHLNRPIPWLLSGDQKSGSDPNRTSLTFYDVTTATSYSVPVNFPLFDDHCWLGSYKGWLVTLNHRLQMHLIKPLTGAHVLLPSIDNIRNDIPWKVVLYHTSDNIDESLVVFCLTEEGSLSVIKIRDEKWTSINYNMYSYFDIISYQGKVYSVSGFALCCYNPRSSSIHKPEMVINMNTFFSSNKYLFEWRDELFMLFMYIDYELSLGKEEASLNQVKLFKVNLSDTSNLLSHISSLDNDALFYAFNVSYAVSVSTSSRGDIRKNCIYFTNQTYEDDTEGFHPNHNFAVFDLGLQSFTPGDHWVVPMRLPLPIWFWPR